MNKQQTKILKLLEAFKKIYGEDYSFLPVATEEELTSFEQKFNCKLPDDYRWFLLNIANGIERDRGLNFVENVNFKDYWYEENEYNPSIPFVLDRKILFHEPEDYDKYPYEFYVYDDSRPEEEVLYYMDAYSNGQVTLRGYGCGTCAFLVVNGNEFGNVWIDDFSSNAQVYPEYDEAKNKKRLTFNDWIIKSIERQIEMHNESIEHERRLAENDKLENSFRTIEISPYKIAPDRQEEIVTNIEQKDERSFFSKLLDMIFN